VGVAWATHVDPAEHGQRLFKISILTPVPPRDLSCDRKKCSMKRDLLRTSLVIVSRPYQFDGARYDFSPDSERHGKRRLTSSRREIHFSLHDFMIPSQKNGRASTPARAVGLGCRTQFHSFQGSRQSNPLENGKRHLGRVLGCLTTI